MIIDLRKPDLKKLKTNTIVITSKGFKFKKMTKGRWKDLTTNLIWYPKEETLYIYNQAIEIFKDKLPTIQEYELAEKHGFRELFDDMNTWFWSSSTDTKDPIDARVFYGNNGDSDYGNRYVHNSVRCVSR